MDALLHEQGRKDREQALLNIEAAMDRGLVGNATRGGPRWSRRLAIIAAAMAICAAATYGVRSNSGKEAARKTVTSGAMPTSEALNQETVAQIEKAIRDQQDKVDERRKVLATIVKTRAITYSGEESMYGRDHLIRRSLDAQDYKDAKRDFESDQNLLAEMRKRAAQAGIVLEDSVATAAPVPSRSPGGLAAPAVASLPRIERPNLENESSGSRETNSERYGAFLDPAWSSPKEKPLSTFSVDVDNASYSNVRRMIQSGQTVPPDAVRIEEFVNAFTYQYPAPAGNKAFALHTILATCPWNEGNLLVKVGIKGREIPENQRPASNLVFLIDVSGSMQHENKLPLVKESLKLLLHRLDERDSVSYVVYAGSEGVALPPTKLTESGRMKALQALESLTAGGSTNGGAGIGRAYQIARENFVKGGVNRVILATDGDFNVGVTGNDQLVAMVKQNAADHVYLSVLGFGTGNLNDNMLEAISKDGNGTHYYIDSIKEGRKVFLGNLAGTLVTIAKDVKIQVEFNPEQVASYRLIGYANRQLKDRDFNDDRVDAGDIGAGHTVTAFYEIVPVTKRDTGVDPLKYQKSAVTPTVETNAVDAASEWLTLKLRHKQPEGDVSELEETVVKGPAIRWQESGRDFPFASAVALSGMKLRGQEPANQITWGRIREMGTTNQEGMSDESRQEFLGLLEMLEKRE